MADATLTNQAHRHAMNPKIDIVVTRHAHLVTVLIERGIAHSDTPVLEHVTSASQVEGLHVAGVLPHHLSCRAASITEIPMRWRKEHRASATNGEFDLAATRAAAGEPVTYIVSKLGTGGIVRARPCWLAQALAYEHVERLGTHFGGGPGRYLTYDSSWCGLTVSLIGDGAGQASAQVIEARGVWRLDAQSPWLDGYGCVVADGDIAPAAGFAKSG